MTLISKVSLFPSAPECEDDEFKCSSGKCIPRRFVCDGTADDCEDNEDESREVCGKFKRYDVFFCRVGCLYFDIFTGCAQDEFMCSSGDCIPESYLCDGITDDCNDNEDESKEKCGAESKCTYANVC